MKPNGTRARAHDEGLTLDQQNAVDLIAAGATDTEAAQKLNLNRVTVTRWRCYSPTFRATLAVRRREVWGAAADRLRALLPKALNVLAEALEGEDRVPAALALLKLAGPLPLVCADATDPDAYVQAEADREADGPHSTAERLKLTMRGLDPDEHLTRARARLHELAEPPAPLQK
jgi:hypothetical protein